MNSKHIHTFFLLALFASAVITASAIVLLIVTLGWRAFAIIAAALLIVALGYRFGNALRYKR